MFAKNVIVKYAPLNTLRYRVPSHRAIPNQVKCRGRPLLDGSSSACKGYDSKRKDRRKIHSERFSDSQ